MSRTDIDAATFANYLRQMCGDGSAEWCYEPMQTSVLLDIADMLDEVAKLREERREYQATIDSLVDECTDHKAENDKLRELVRHMNTCLEHYEPDGSVGCEHCPLDNDAGNCDYERRMHELEVTE